MKFPLNFLIVAAAIDLRTTVYGALTVYDWPDLLPKALGGKDNPGEE